MLVYDSWHVFHLLALFLFAFHVFMICDQHLIVIAIDFMMSVVHLMSPRPRINVVNHLFDK